MKTVCGLDVHKDSVYVCVLQENGEKFEAKFGTLTPDLYRLHETLCDYHVEQVAMESTSIYWMPVWNILSDKFVLKLVNPYFIRQLPGRKSDVKDAEWIATALQKELIKDSYVPPSHVQEMRQLGREQSRLRKRIIRVEQSIDMQLQRCNIRLSNYLSDIGAVSMRKVVRAIIQGETRSEVLASLVHSRIKNKHGKQTIINSLCGVIKTVDIIMLNNIWKNLNCWKSTNKNA